MSGGGGERQRVNYDGGNERKKKEKWRPAWWLNGDGDASRLASSCINIPTWTTTYPGARRCENGHGNACDSEGEEKKKNRTCLSTVAAIPPHSYIFCFL
jgi:hypothetical protein